MLVAMLRPVVYALVADGFQKMHNCSGDDDATDAKKPQLGVSFREVLLQAK